MPSAAVAAIALAVVAVALLAVTVATARPLGSPVPGRESYFDRWSALHGGYDPRRAFWPRTWLGVSHAVARPLAARGVLPDVLTAWGAVVSAGVVVLALAGGRWPLLAVLVIVASGLADNLDGAVAVLTDRATAFGSVLDSVVDRVSDALYLVALWVLGAPAGVCVLGGALMGVQEYARARAGAAGMSEVGVVTAWERPTRVVVTAFTLAGCGLVLPLADLAATAGAWSWVGLGVVGCGQLFPAVRRSLAPR